VSVYSDQTFARQDGLAKSEIRDSPAVEIHREEGDVSFQPSSVDLHLGGEFLEQKSQKQPIKVDHRETYPRYDFKGTDEDGYYHVKPGQFVLATTQETVSLDDSVVAYLWGRSSVGRLGLFVHNAGLVDSAYSGQLTLEIKNPTNNTIALKEGMRIVQMTVHELTEPSSVGYDEQVRSKYEGQAGVTPSRLHRDFLNEDVESQSESTSETTVTQSCEEDQ